MKNSSRFDIAPWLKEYKAIGQVLKPYVIKISTPSFRSPVVNTDVYGFRHSTDPQGCVDSETWFQRSRRGLILGSSFAFGVGVTQDAATLSSRLNFLTNISFHNLAIRAANSTQEWMAAIPFVEKADCILVVSGLNNLIANLQSLHFNDLYNPLFGEEIFEELSSYDFSQLSLLLGYERGFARNLLRKCFLRPRNGEKKSLQETPSLEEASEKALSFLKRDLRFLRGMVPSNCRICYCMQPLAQLSTKIPETREKKLFEIFEEEMIQGDLWRRLQNKIVELWPGYISQMETALRRLEIPFVDLNQTPLTGWSYIDPVHMTDHGMKQVAQFINQVRVLP